MSRPRYGSRAETLTLAVGVHLRQALVVVAREDDAELTRLRVVLLEETEGADLLEPDVHRAARVLLLERDGVLDALLAAGARAVGLVLVERAGAEDEADRLDLGERRVVLLEHALEVHPGDDLLAATRGRTGRGGPRVVPVATMTTPLSIAVRLPSFSPMTLEKLPMKPWKSTSSASRWILTLGLSTRRCSSCLTSAVGSLPLMVSPSSRHVAAELGRALDEVDLVAHVAERQGAGHAGDAAADDDGGVRERHVDLEQRLEQPGPGHAHLDQFLGLLRGLLRLLGVHPARLVADVGHLEEERVEPGLAQGVLEDGLVRARRAAGDDDAVEVVLLDRLADEREAVRGARVHRVGGEGHAGQLSWRTRRRSRRR